MRNITPFGNPGIGKTSVITLPRIVGVTFSGSGGTEYSYYCDIPDIEVGDYAIVASPYSSQQPNFRSPELDGYPTVVRVVSTQETVKAVAKAAKWIIQKVDIDRYVQRLSYERQVDVLRAKIEKAKKAALEQAQLASLMSLSPELNT